jgi:hypothetical protein
MRLKLKKQHTILSLSAVKTDYKNIFPGEKGISKVREKYSRVILYLTSQPVQSQCRIRKSDSGRKRLIQIKPPHGCIT